MSDGGCALCFCGFRMHMRSCFARAGTVNTAGDDIFPQLTGGGDIMSEDQFRRFVKTLQGHGLLEQPHVDWQVNVESCMAGPTNHIGFVTS